ncbi:hypothetical protein AAG570_004186 [Ranatra chinensis]|uniref:CRAL-TRIO domain-containing protein n=1 Tax=Ranatra chinensis TaxID=642074 RepID=A0ABD0YFL3_9HEMI
MIQHLLHACYYNVEQAKKTIDSLYTFKNTMPEFFQRWDVNGEEIQEIVRNVVMMAPLPKIDPDGNKIMVCKLSDSDPKKFNYPLCVRWLFMSCYNALWSTGIHKGYVLIYDASGFSMSHLLRCQLNHVRNYISFGEKAAPMRVLKVVIINTSPVVKKLMGLVRPFLNKELLNLISFHTTPDSYFKDLPTECIPEDYGGAAPSLSFLHDEYLKEMTSSREWFLEEEKIRSDENKRASKSKGSSSSKSESFSSLEID